MKKIHKILSIVLVLFLLGWGMSSLAEDDISSAHSNFSVVGIISDISDDIIKIDQSKGSDKSDRTSYDLNISHLSKIETDKYVSINKTDLKKGDKIIAQGLTNGSTFFIKRIVSFSYLAVENNDVASTTEDVAVSESVSTTTDPVDSSVNISTTTSTTTDNTPVVTSDLINNATSDTNSTSTTGDLISTTTDVILSTTTEDISTSTSTTTENIIDKVVDTVQNIVDTVTETVTDVVESIIDTVSNNETPAPAPIDESVTNTQI